jgi:hypothetical protein
MIEALIKELIAALNANTAAHGGNAAGEVTSTAADTAATAATTTTKGAGKTTGKTTTKTTTPKGPSREEVVALLTKIKDEHGAAEAKPLVALAGVVKMAEIPDDKLKLVFDAATKYLEPAAEDGEDDGDL